MMKAIAVLAAMMPGPSSDTPQCGAPYCMTGYGEGALPYWTRESIFSDAKKFSNEGFPIEIWTSFGKKIYPMPEN